MIKKILFTILLSVLVFPALNAETATTNGKKKILMEDFLGDWCGYCPRTIATERHLSKKYSNDLVIVNYLYGATSPTSIRTFNDVVNAWKSCFIDVTAFPTTYFCRNLEQAEFCDPTVSNIERLYDFIESGSETDALDFRFSATINDNDVMFFKAEFGQDAIQANKYRITFLAQIDDLLVKQSNYYRGVTSELELIPEIEPFIKGAQNIETEIDNVVIANSDFNGLPIETTNVEYSLPLPSLSGISFNNYIATAIITDNDGNYVNALTVKVTEKEKGIESITILNKEKQIYYVGQTTRFVTVVYPNEYPEDETLVWTSSDEDVAMVNPSTGEVKFIAPGSVTITVASSKNPDISDSVNIISEYPFIYGLRFEEPRKDIETGTSYQLEFAVAGIEGWENYDHLVWSSSDEAIATVNEDGVITALSEGTVVIKAHSFIDDTYEGWSISLTIKPSLTKVSTPIRKLYRDTKAMIPLQLKNIYGILGMQCDITLSEGTVFATDESGLCYVTLDKNRTPRHSVSLNVQDERHLRLIVNSANNTVIEPGEGDFLYIPVLITNDADDIFTFTVTNTSLSDVNSNSISISDYKGEYPVEDLTRGDLNGDNKIDVADVTATVSVIMNSASANITPEAGDFNGDGKTDISDIVALIDHILTAPMSAKRNIAADNEESSDEQPEIALNFATDVTFECGKEADFKLRLTNIPPAIAAQFDIELPENFEFVENDSELAIALCGEAENTHQITTSRIDDKTARVLIYSMSNIPFDVTNDFLTLSVKVAENAADEEDINFNDIKLISEDRSEITFETAVLKVLETGHASASVTGTVENVSVDGKTITVSNLTGDSPVMLYLPSGQLIDSAIPCNGTVRFNAPRGLCILKTSTNAYSIAIR